MAATSANMAQSNFTLFCPQFSKLLFALTLRTLNILPHLRCQEIPEESLDESASLQRLRSPVSMLFLKLMCRGLWLLPSWTFTPNTFIFCPFFMAYRYTPGLFILLNSHPLAYIPSRHQGTCCTGARLEYPLS